MKKKIEEFVFKTISLEQLEKMSGGIDYQQFAQLIYCYTKEGLLKPMKKMQLNGRSPALYNKYHIIKPEKDYTEAIQNIKLLHSKFNHAKYTAKPDIYLKYKKEIDALSSFLWEKEDLLKEPLSINERSFQIWGIEKLLKETTIIDSIFKFNGWDIKDLNYFETPEPFFEYIHQTEELMNVLIIENKDTWYSLRKIMQEENINHLFRPYNVLLYGEGKKITSKNNRLNEYDQLSAGSSTYYYFGDLDYEGIAIYESLLEKNSSLDIRLCTDLYSAMLKEADRYKLPPTKEKQKRRDIQEFLSQFIGIEKEKVKTILESGCYIPQEILHYSWMKAKMLEGHR